MGIPLPGNVNCALTKSTRLDFGVADGKGEEEGLLRKRRIAPLKQASTS